MCLLSDFSFVVLRYASELWWPSNVFALIMIVEVVMLGITVSKVRINGKALDFAMRDPSDELLLPRPLLVIFFLMLIDEP